MGEEVFGKMKTLFHAVGLELRRCFELDSNHLRSITILETEWVQQ